MSSKRPLHVRPLRTASIGAVAFTLVASSLAIAAPKRKDARKEFDKGVAAYTKKDYEAARTALAASAKLESDVETLFALAQTERQLGNCDRAIELYEQLLDMEMPAANKKAIRPKIDECKKLIAAQNPPPPVEEPEADPVSEPAEAAREPTPAPSSPPQPEHPPDRGSSSSGLEHVIGGGMLGLGTVGLVVGGYFLFAGRQADLDSKEAKNYFDYIQLRDEADLKGRTGVIAASIGGAFVVAGIIWYATRSNGDSETKVTGWLTPDGGGVTALGRF